MPGLLNNRALCEPKSTTMDDAMVYLGLPANTNRYLKVSLEKLPSFVTNKNINF
ncbi:hypothetical protein M0804_014564 [Polistes exclamans]|nr:hypothetical protein M0804_014565 [Polistes exclamans]KAI4474980.1 hypothetical protein M0804_014564 [Polistes exclamans]